MVTKPLENKSLTQEQYFFLYLAGNDVTLLHCVSFTPFSVVAVRLNDIHIFWIAIGSGSRLRRNSASPSDSEACPLHVT